MFKRVVLIVLIAIIALIGASYLFFLEESSDKSAEMSVNEKSINIGGVDLLVDIADDPIEQAQGLSGRDLMAENRGMLFVFPQPTTPGFWMKDMKFSLDLIWIDEGGKIVEITKDVSPATYPKTFMPPSPVKYVLEVNAGWSDRNKIKSGDKITEL